ncbi:hypothetical protein RE6C_00172 [Rhodopirellula europaea 6C]|uniref:Uncharacterized protein n=1 Tax=Rhodopirellula europaea 6C TaxID=1263867 RepID=M2BAA3_9BACT|nr:hypothetical protein RE6C_00172 [Rhodopirellula europaea 6C]
MLFGASRDGQIETLFDAGHALSRCHEWALCEICNKVGSSQSPQRFSERKDRKKCRGPSKWTLLHSVRRLTTADHRRSRTEICHLVRPRPPQ